MSRPLDDTKFAPFAPGKLREFDNKLYQHADSGQVVHAKPEFVETGAEAHARLLQTKKLLEELPDKYGIDVVDFYPIVGHKQGRNIGSIVVSNFIDGKKFGVNRLAEQLTDEEQRAAVSLLYRLTNYVKDKHNKQEPFLSDIGSIEQYMYNPETANFVMNDPEAKYGEGYAAEGMMLSNMSLWAKGLLPHDEFVEWHSDAIEAIRPAA